MYCMCDSLGMYSVQMLPCTPSTCAACSASAAGTGSKEYTRSSGRWPPIAGGSAAVSWDW